MPSVQRMTVHEKLRRRIVDELRKHGCLVTPGGGVTHRLDLMICTPAGRYAELDPKVGRDKLKPGQAHRASVIRGLNGIAGEVRSVEEALRLLDLE